VYRLKLTRHANRDFQKLPPYDFDYVAGALKILRENPRPPGITKLISGLYRVRAGNWRIIYTIFDKENLVLVLKIVRRSEDTYDKLKDLI
jgi:mRNA interferase RelE/StbE